MRNTKGQAGTVVVFMFIVVCAIGIAALFGTFVIVSSGNVGVKRTLGKVADKELQPGLHFLTPFVDRVDHVNTQIQVKNDKASASSKDLQTVTTSVTIQYSAKPDKAVEIIKNVGNLQTLETRVLHPAVPETVKAVTAQYTVEELVTKRALVKKGITEALEEFIHDTLRKKGIPEAIEIHNIAITDFNFSQQFIDSIEAKVKAEQDALRAKNEKLTAITQAEAAAAKVKLEGDANAYRITAVARAEANAIKIKAQALRENPGIVQLEAVNKWNGEVPRFSSNSNPVPFINVTEEGK